MRNSNYSSQKTLQWFCFQKSYLKILGGQIFNSYPNSDVKMCHWSDPKSIPRENNVDTLNLPIEWNSE